MPNEVANLSEQFGALPMEALIGAPLTAACNSQTKLAKATSDFIQNVGLDKDGNVQTAAFKYTKVVRDENGAETPQSMRLDVPLLSIVNIPSLAVRTVDITFDMEVKSSFEEKSKTDASATAEAGGGFFGVSFKVSGTVSTHKEQTRKSDNSAKYHVQVLARDDGMPEGLSRVMDIIQASITPTLDNPEKKKSLEEQGL